MTLEGRGLDTTKEVYPYLAYVMLFKLMIYCFETFLDFRQYSKFKDMEVPADIRGFVKKSFFQESQSYNRDMKKFSILKGIYNFLWEMISLYFQFLALIWENGYVLNKLGLDPDSEINRAYYTFFVLYLISTIMGLPWSYYSTFVIKQKHGSNNMTFSTFIMDTVKQTILVVVLLLVITPLFIKIMELGGENFYIYLFIFIVIFSMIMLWLVPNFIMPLFNKYEDIEEGELKDKVYALAGKLDFPLKKLFIMDASTRTTNSNAYFFGFGSNKRIVLFDTLIKHLETDEIVAVVAHELGHWKMYHSIINLVYAFSSMFLTFYVFSFVIKRDDILIDFGFSEHYNTVALLVFMEIYSPVDYLQTLIQTFYTRILEFQADRFANDLGYKEQLMKGLIRLHIKNKANLNPDPLYATYHFSHPELVERLRALGDYYDVISIEELEEKEEQVKKAEQEQKKEDKADAQDTQDTQQHTSDKEKTE